MRQITNSAILQNSGYGKVNTITGEFKENKPQNITSCTAPPPHTHTHPRGPKQTNYKGITPSTPHPLANK
jgi:hypothetical protein